MQGDVTAIMDGSGATVATYVYDAWGNLISDEPAENTIGHLNPIRYRGYIFDSESDLYYLQSRYYDPELGRFLNADSLISTGQGILGNNMYVYCLNNPVSYIDNCGTACKWIPTTLEEAEEKVLEYMTDSNAYGVIISGSAVTVSSILKSTISQLQAAPRPANIGAGIYAKTLDNDIAYIKGVDSTVAKAFGILAYGAVVIDVYQGVNANIAKGATTEKILYDASVDIVITGGTIWVAGALGSKIGTLAGSFFPGAGNIIGGVAGFVIGAGIYVLTDMIDYNGKTARGWAKEVVN